MSDTVKNDLHPKKSRSNTTCCVYGCKSIRRNNPNLTFHLFPKKGHKIDVVSEFGEKTTIERRRLWETKLKMYKNASNAMSVCSLHFDEADYTCSGWSTQKRLLPSAVPSKNLPRSSQQSDIGEWRKGSCMRCGRKRQKTTVVKQNRLKDRNSTIETNPTVRMDIITDLSKKSRLFNCANTIKSFRCSQCTNFETHMLAELKQHFKAGHTLRKSEEKLYKCGNCSFQTYSNYLYLRHKLFYLCPLQLKIKSEEVVPQENHNGQLKCQNYDFETAEKDNLGFSNSNHKTPSRSVKNKRKSGRMEHWKCDLCQDLPIAVKHTNSDQVQWLQCVNYSYKTKVKYYLNRHMKRMHSNENPLKCDHCQVEIKSKRKLQAHILLQHTDPDQLKRSKCDPSVYKATSESILNHHKDFGRGNEARFKCDHCPFQIKSKRELEAHIFMKHKPVKWFESEHCSVKMQSNYHLKTHLKRMHCDRAALKCDHCRFETLYKSSLQGHILAQHTDLRRIQWFKCNSCIYMAKTKSNLKQHMDYKHGD